MSTEALKYYGKLAAGRFAVVFFLLTYGWLLYTDWRAIVLFLTYFFVLWNPAKPMQRAKPLEAR